jgi:putative transcriptional regulator
MSQAKRYRSGPLLSLHSVAEDLYGVGLIDRTMMRDFDLVCLTAVEPLGPEAIKQIRAKAPMSQTTFALALNLTTLLVSKREGGEVRPSSLSLKLLALVNSKGVEAIL